MNMRTLSPAMVRSAIPAIIPENPMVETGEKVFKDSHRKSNTNGDFVLNKNEDYLMGQDSFPPDTRNNTDDTSHCTPMPPSEKAGFSPFDLLFDRQNVHQDEGITLEEFSAAWSKAIKERFAKLNANGDGASNKDKRVTNRNVEGNPPRSPWDSTT